MPIFEDIRRGKLSTLKCPPLIFSTYSRLSPPLSERANMSTPARTSAFQINDRIHPKSITIPCKDDFPGVQSPEQDDHPIVHSCTVPAGRAAGRTTTSLMHSLDLLSGICEISVLSNIRRNNFRQSFSSAAVTLRPPSLDSETRWTRELWSKANLPNWQN